MPMNAQTLQERIDSVRQKRGKLIELLEKPDLGTLRIDVNQALEELDDLVDEYQRTFPDAK